MNGLERKGKALVDTIGLAFSKSARESGSDEDVRGVSVWVGGRMWGAGRWVFFFSFFFLRGESSRMCRCVWPGCDVGGREVGYAKGTGGMKEVGMRMRV